MQETRHNYIWEGIYTSFNEVAISQDSFNEDIWIQLLLESLTTTISSLSSNQPIPGVNTDEKNLLPFLISMEHGNNKRPVSIIDFGGGLGIDFLIAQKKVGRGVIEKYYIIEKAQVNQLGTEIYKNEDIVTFGQEVPCVKYDIIYMDSSLQYVENWQDLICTLAKCQPDYFLFVRTPVGDIPTYVSAQVNMPGMTMPYKFFNFSQFTAVMSSFGYDLIFSSNSDRKYEQNNFPPAYRLGNARSMLFMRVK